MTSMEASRLKSNATKPKPSTSNSVTRHKLGYSTNELAASARSRSGSVRTGQGRDANYISSVVNTPTKEPNFIFHSKKRHEEKERIILENKRLGERIIKTNSAIPKTTSLLRDNLVHKQRVQNVTRYKPGKDKNSFVIVGSLVSTHGNYNLKESYKKKFSHTNYVKGEMNGLALLKGSFNRKNGSVPTLKACNSAFLENYLLAEREKRMKKFEESRGGMPAFQSQSRKNSRSESELGRGYKGRPQVGAITAMPKTRPKNNVRYF